MRLNICAAAFLLSITLYLSAPAAHAQRVTEGQDSVLVPVSDTLNVGKGFFLSNWDRPARAALFSAVIPGAGQIYNHSYWKLPIIYGTAAVLAYYWIDNNNKYQDFRIATNQRATQSDKYVDSPIYGTSNPRGTQNLRYSRDYYRRNRDLTILLSIGAYGLQVAEAYVHAHMKQFDVGENLSLRMQPDLMRVPQTNTYSPGLTLTLFTTSNTK